LFSCNNAHRCACDAEHFGEEIDERSVCRTVDGWRRESDFDRLAVQTSDLSSRSPGLHVNGKSDAAAAVVNSWQRVQGSHALRADCRPDESQHGRLEYPREQQVRDDWRDVDHPE